MREHVLPTLSTPARGARRLPGALTRLLHRLALWLEVRRQRRQLMAMSDHMLRDMGISRADAEGEAMRPFWDLPGSWR